MLNTKQRVARYRYDCPAVTPSAQDAIRLLDRLNTCSGYTISIVEP
jgi:hypothetical protein